MADEQSPEPRLVRVSRWTDFPKRALFCDLWTVRRWESMGVRIVDSAEEAESMLVGLTQARRVWW